MTSRDSILSDSKTVQLALDGEIDTNFNILSLSQDIIFFGLPVLKSLLMISKKKGCSFSFKKLINWSKCPNISCFLLKEMIEKPSSFRRWYINFIIKRMYKYYFK